MFKFLVFFSTLYTISLHFLSSICFTDCSKSYSSFILLKNVLSFKQIWLCFWLWLCTFWLGYAHSVCLYRFYNKYACFLIYKNYFLFFTCFKKVDFLDSQPAHIDFCWCILFSNATPFMFFLSVFFLQTKQYFFPFSNILVFVLI